MKTATYIKVYLFRIALPILHSPLVLVRYHMCLPTREPVPEKETVASASYCRGLRLDWKSGGYC